MKIKAYGAYYQNAQDGEIYHYDKMTDEDIEWLKEQNGRGKYE